MATGLVTIGELQKRFNLPAWRLRRELDKRPARLDRIAGVRVVRECDVPNIERQLRAAGYLPADSSAV